MGNKPIQTRNYAYMVWVCFGKKIDVSQVTILENWFWDTGSKTQHCQLCWVTIYNGRKFLGLNCCEGDDLTFLRALEVIRIASHSWQLVLDFDVGWQTTVDYTFGKPKAGLDGPELWDHGCWSGKQWLTDPGWSWSYSSVAPYSIQRILNPNDRRCLPIGLRCKGYE